MLTDFNRSVVVHNIKKHEALSWWQKLEKVITV